jgi:hypothetical protein
LFARWQSLRSRVVPRIAKLIKIAKELQQVAIRDFDGLTVQAKTSNRISEKRVEKKNCIKNPIHKPVRGWGIVGTLRPATGNPHVIGRRSSLEPQLFHVTEREILTQRTLAPILILNYNFHQVEVFSVWIETIK